MSMEDQGWGGGDAWGQEPNETGPPVDQGAVDEGQPVSPVADPPGGPDSADHSDIPGSAGATRSRARFSRRRQRGGTEARVGRRLDDPAHPLLASPFVVAGSDVELVRAHLSAGPPSTPAAVELIDDERPRFGQSAHRWFDQREAAMRLHYGRSYRRLAIQAVPADVLGRLLDGDGAPKIRGVDLRYAGGDTSEYHERIVQFGPARLVVRAQAGHAAAIDGAVVLSAGPSGYRMPLALLAPAADWTFNDEIELVVGDDRSRRLRLTLISQPAEGRDLGSVAASTSERLQQAGRLRALSPSINIRAHFGQRTLDAVLVEGTFDGAARSLMLSGICDGRACTTIAAPSKRLGREEILALLAVRVSITDRASRA